MPKSSPPPPPPPLDSGHFGYITQLAKQNTVTLNQDSVNPASTSAA